MGASAATKAVAKWLSAIVLVSLVLHTARRRQVSLRPHPTVIRSLSGTSAPLFARTLSLRTGLTVAAAVASNMGTRASAAYAIGTQVWSLVAYLCEGFEVAHTLVGSALGGGDGARARQVGRRILRWSAVLGVGAAALLVASRHLIPGWFTDDPAVSALTASSLLWIAAMQPVNMIAFAFDGILIGAGDLRFLAVGMAVATSLYVAVALVVGALGAGVNGLWVALFTQMAARALLLATRFRGDRWIRLGASATHTPD